MTDLDQHRRGIIGTALRVTCGPVWYWLGLLDGDGHPSHWLIIGTLGYIWGLVLVSDAWQWLFSRWGAHTASVWEFSFLLAFSALVFVAPYGLQGLQAWFDWKGSTPSKGP